MIKLPKNTIVVEVSGGMVVKVFANPRASVLVVDHDNGAGDLPLWMATDPIKSITPDLKTILKRKIKDLIQ